MTEVNPKNTRFDPVLVECRNNAKPMAKSVAYTFAALEINMNVWTRLKLAQGTIPMDEI